MTDCSYDNQQQDTIGNAHVRLYALSTRT